LSERPRRCAVLSSSRKRIETIPARRAFASSSAILCRQRERAAARDRNVASKSRLSAIFANACAQLQIGL
jgi:hypothetical protein